METDEIVYHTISKCRKLAEKKDKTGYDRIGLSKISEEKYKTTQTTTL